MNPQKTVASEFENYTHLELSVFKHKICGWDVDFPNFSNLQHILATLFNHANECNKERNPESKRKAPNGTW